ncbi:MAG: LysR family transcriptional regulator [Herminiimonas sp.]|nr:LysR family transcriptional regulator [Herminiimonas sp.]
MDKFQAMEVFVQVVDAGGFTRAADNMGLPKATVSTLIQSLEAALTVKLLNRTTRRVSVTTDGAAYYERCLRILAEVRDTEESLSRTRASPSGRLRVDVATGLATQIIVPALSQFFDRYPDIVLQLGCGDRPIDLIEEGVDCAVRGGNLADSTLIARRVGAIRFATVASPSYLARYGTPQHPDELVRHRCVNYFSARSGKLMDWDFTRGDEHVELSLPGPVSMNDSNAYLIAGLSGLGIIRIPSFHVPRHVATGELVPLLQDWTVAPVALHVVYPQNRHLSAKVRVFVEWIAELIDSHEGLRSSPRKT